ncbi:hypothetical protein NL676_014145 [Syzygium grande]|nr:hypothetical protein NL676_014145 [Syzygium grande]
MSLFLEPQPCLNYLSSLPSSPWCRLELPRACSHGARASSWGGGNLKLASLTVRARSHGHSSFVELMDRMRFGACGHGSWSFIDLKAINVALAFFELSD